MRVFDSFSTHSPKSASTPERGPRKKSARAKNQTRGRVEMSPEQIRAKVEARNANKTSLKEKLAKTKEISSFLSEDAAAKVSLTSINKNSQKFPKSKPAMGDNDLAPNLVSATADTESEIFEAQVEISEGEELEVGAELDPNRPGALQNDPTDSLTVNKLKEALNSGVFKVDAKTRNVLSEIISSRT